MFNSELALLQKLGNPTALQESFFGYLLAAGVIGRNEVERVKREKTFQSVLLYHAKDIEGLTKDDFFTGALATAADSNMSSFISNKDEHKLIYAIKAYAGAAGTVMATAWTEGIPGGDVSNGTFKITVNGQLQLPKTLLQNFVEADEDADAGVFVLEKPIVWPGQQDIAVSCDWPTAPATTNQNLMFELVTLGLF